MAILGEQNILDSTFKAFNSKEETSAKNKFSSQDFGVISNQFSTVFSQQVSDNSYTSYTKTYGDQEKTSSYDSTSENKYEEKNSDYSQKTSKEDQGYYYYQDNNPNAPSNREHHTTSKPENSDSGSNIEKYQKHTTEKGEKAGHHTKHNTDKSDVNVKPEAVLQGKNPAESTDIKDKTALGAHLDNLLKTKTKESASRQKVVEAPDAKTTMTKDELAALKQAMKGSNNNILKPESKNS
jgi:hypothetical protein